jgi:hypothetical protein
LAVRDDPDNGHWERLLYLLDQECQIVVSGREQTPGQEDLAGEAIAQYPEDFMADLGLETIEGQDDATTDLGDTVEARRVLQREGDQFIVTLQEIRDRPWGHCHVALDQGLMDFWDTAVVAIALLPHEGDDVKTKLVLGKCQAPFVFGTVGVVHVRTGLVETATNLEGEPQDRVERGDGPVVMVGSPQRLATGGAGAQERFQNLPFSGGGSGGNTCHSRYLHESFYSWYRYLTRALAQFATLEKKENITTMLFVLTLWLAAAFGSICFQRTAFANADVEQDFFKLPVNFVTLNTCTGEFIQVQGTALIGFVLTNLQSAARKVTKQISV